MIDRQRRATDWRIKESQFPVIKTNDSFDFKAQPSINEPLARELLRDEYIPKKENLLLVGNPGTGKAHLACDLGFAACSQGKRVRFYTTTGLVTLYLDAGVAAANGFPNWPQLVLAMYFTAVSEDWKQRWRPYPSYLSAIAQWCLERSKEPKEITA